MIINAGLDRVICSTNEEENLKIFFVDQWIKEWQAKDIIEDQHKYG
jgi:hypothetical protein